jgi:hypothetical protein
MAKRFRVPANILAIAFAGSLLMPAARAEEQPHMREALEHLKAAQAELAKASHDKGGHRARAQQLVTQAIQQVEQGMKYDQTHESRKEEKREKEHQH